MLASDVRIGTAGPYKIGMNEAAIGIKLPKWAVVLANNRLTRRAAQLTFIKGHLYAPNEAIAAGFLDKIADDDARLAAVDEAEKLSSIDLETYRENELSARTDCLSEIMQHISDF